MLHLSGRLVKDVNLAVAPGEIVGVTGRVGCGKSELGRLLFGNQAPTAGSILLDGVAVSHLTPRRAIDRGIAYVPQDRAREGLIATASLAENASLSGFAHAWRRGWLSFRRERRVIGEHLRRFRVTPPAPDRIANTLSGGNQQKVIFAKWLRHPLRVLILDEPTMGVDVGARADLYRIIAEAARVGTAVLVLSSSFEEIAQLCSRAIVMRDGRVTNELRGPDMTTASLMHASLEGWGKE
jgi:ABC-type sugar transport system ATPase subunit